MKLPLFLALGVAALSLSAFAQDPVYTIARVHKGPNGSMDDTDFFRVEQLAGNHGWEEMSPSMSMAYDENGLVLYMEFFDDFQYDIGEKADMTVANPAKWDSVEIFFGGKKETGQYYRATVSLDFDPSTGKPRIDVHDFRKPAPSDPPKVDVEFNSTKGMWSMTARLPWALNVAKLKPMPGMEVSLQVYVNITDAAGVRRTVSWHPEYRVHDDPAAMYRLVLGAKSSPAVRMAVRASLDDMRPRVDVYARNDFAEKPVEMKQAGKPVATSLFEPKGAHPGVCASFFVPVEADAIVAQGEKAEIDYTNIPDLVFAGVLEVKPYFKQAVFSGTKFPPCELEPGHEMQAALGRCILTPTFYDANYNEVSSAEKPGRYGAIIRVEVANGQQFQRYVTLYRAPGELLGRDFRAQFSGIELPRELGIDPAVISPRVRNVEALFNNQLRAWDGMNRGPDAAVVLAWLSEQKADAPAADVMRNGPFAADQKWWYGLKKKTENLRKDYFVYLPPDYDKDPQKKWPLIVFLHGSGERGYDLKLLERQPLPQGIDDRENFPFIVIAPQCNPGEWWSIPELDDMLESLPAKYRIDPDRVYLTGLSMGGYGTWAWAAAEPKRFAAIVPICGGGDPQDVKQLKDLPVWAFHGDKDDAVPMERSQEMVEALKKAGGDPKFTIVAGAGHIETWLKAYSTPELFEWLLQQRRK